MSSPGPRLGPRGHEVKRRVKSTATLEPLDQGPLTSSASAPHLRPLPSVGPRRLKGGSSFSSVSLKDHEEFFEIQDFKKVERPDRRPDGSREGSRQSRPGGSRDLEGSERGMDFEGKQEGCDGKLWRLAAARVVEDRAARQKVNLQVLDGEIETEEDTRLPQSVAAFDTPQRELTAYEKACFAKRLLPKFMGCVKDAVSGPVLDLCSCGLGDDQLVAVFADPELIPWRHIRRWRLRDARMRDRGALHLSKLLTEVEALDLVNNEIGVAGARGLADALGRRSYEQLQRLDLSANSLNDDAVSCLAAALKNCEGLLRLDLRQNCMQDGHHLGELIAGHGQLTRLSLRRNRITGPGMAALFRGILENARTGGQFADVDAAWNPMASGGIVAAKAMAQVFQESATLYHCDLSYCQLDAAACAALGDGLRDNHSLYGLHMVGNSAAMDADGFLMPMEMKTSETGLRFGDLQAGPEALLGAGRAGSFAQEDDLKGRDVLEMRSACWACEGWERQEITWSSQDTQPKAVWAFTSLDDFRRPLRLHPDGGRYRAARMVPPGYRLKVIFQVDSTLQLLPEETIAQPVEVVLRISEDLPELTPDEEQIRRTDISPRSGRKIFVAGHDHVNIIRGLATKTETEARGVVIGPMDGSAVLLPRVTETEFKAKVTRAPPFWSSFKHETPKIRRDALRVDWMRCRLGHVVPEAEVEDIKKALEPHYGWLMCLYRRISSGDVSGEGFGISQLQAGELMMSAGICDGATTKVADIDRFFIAAKVTPAELRKTMVVVNDKTLVRYEFLEILLRVANHHFLKSGVAQNMTEAMALLLQAFEQDGRQAEQELNAFFRALCREAVDDLFKKYTDLLAALYKRFGGSKTPPGKPKFMALTEFQELLEEAKIHSILGFQPRQSSYAFRLGMMSQTDESGSSRFQEMTLLEFQVALGAVAFLVDAQLLPALKRIFSLLIDLHKGAKEKVAK